jgi:multiple antibiotic resistance protein
VNFTAVTTFLLFFPALFSIVNPIGGAFIFHTVTLPFTHDDRVRVSRQIGLYALGVLLFAMWAGTYVLNFFGISLGALRVAGGIAVAISAWELLTSPQRRDVRKQEQASSDRTALSEMAFFPLTMPFTTGPGTIAVAITLGADLPRRASDRPGFIIGGSVAALAISLTVWLFYAYADRVAGWIGPSARQTISRLTAFLLLCVGVQIAISGVDDVVYTFLLDHEFAR